MTGSLEGRGGGDDMYDQGFELDELQMELMALDGRRYHCSQILVSLGLRLQARENPELLRHRFQSPSSQSRRFPSPALSKPLPSRRNAPRTVPFARRRFPAPVRYKPARKNARESTGSAFPAAEFRSGRYRSEWPCGSGSPFQRSSARDDRPVQLHVPARRIENFLCADPRELSADLTIIIEPQSIAFDPEQSAADPAI